MSDMANSSVAWYYVPLRSTSETLGFIILYCLLVLFIMTGNTLVIIAYKNSMSVRQRVTNLFFVSLAVSDLLVGAISVPLWMYYIYCSHTGASHCHEDHFIKYVYRHFDILSALASIAHLTIISIERNIAISSVSPRVRSSTKCHYLMLAAAWLYAVSVSVAYAVCYRKNYKVLRTLLVFLGGFFIPVLIIASMYFKIYRKLNVIDKCRPREQDQGTLVCRPESRRERQVLVTVAIVIILFILAWLPFFIVSMMFTFCPACLPRGAYILRLMDFVKFMQYSNSAVNPCVYSYRNTEIKEAIRRFMGGCFIRESPTPRRRNELQLHLIKL